MTYHEIQMLNDYIRTLAKKRALEVRPKPCPIGVGGSLSSVPGDVILERKNKNAKTNADCELKAIIESLYCLVALPKKL